MAIAKDPRERDRPYMAWVAKLPCLACMCHGKYTRGVHVCHIRLSRAEAGWLNPGMQQKPHDRRVWPGCPSHHLYGKDSQHHAGDEARWWEELGVDPVEFVAALNAAYDAGHSGGAVVAAFAARAARKRAGEWSEGVTPAVLAATRKYREKTQRPLPSVINLPGEVWLPVVGREGFYSVSNFGRVKSDARVAMQEVNTSKPGKLWPRKIRERLRSTYVGRGGYIAVGIRGTGKKSATHHVHVLVCEAFHGPCPEGMWALHKNDVRHENHADNLYWGTQQDNADDAVANGRIKRGFDSPQAALTPQEVAICRGSRGIVASEELGKLLGVSGSTVRKIIRVASVYPEIAAAPPTNVRAFLAAKRRGATEETPLVH